MMSTVILIGFLALACATWEFALRSLARKE
jgi:hypothetical protein